MVGDDNTLLPSSFTSKSASMMMANDHDVSTRSAVVVVDDHNHFNYFDHHSSISGVNYLSNAGYLFGTDQLSVKAVDHDDNSKDDVLAEHQNVPHHRDGDDDSDGGSDDDSESPDRVAER